MSLPRVCPRRFSNPSHPRRSLSADPPIPATDPVDTGTSYARILRSSSIIGGAQGLNYLVGLVRTKLVAVLLGTSGVGLVGLYISVTGLVGTLTGLGVGSSGVREVAEAHASGDGERVGRTIRTLRRACWVTGLIGWVATALLSWPLSQWAFASPERAGALALLGGTLFFAALAGGQVAVLQGTRRIGDIARVNVVSMLAGTVLAVGLYAWLGERGIVPVLLGTALINLGASWWFSRRVPVVPVALGWGETWRQSQRLVGLGLAFVWSGLLTAAVGLVTRAWIVRDFGLDANGIYQAAWGISGMFAGFILGAIGADFYPRLTAAAGDDVEVNRLVNEQTEIGILLALPGLLATLAFAPWMMSLFYSAQFVAGAELLPWFVLGIFGRVVSWPMGYILLAKGASRWFAAAETISNALLLGLTLAFLQWQGLRGVALAFALLYACQCVGMTAVARHLTGFRWRAAALRLLGWSGALVVCGFAAQRWVPGLAGIAVGALLLALGSVASLRGIAGRLGAGHRWVRSACALPGGRWICGV